MDHTFDVDAFISRVGGRLVQEFDDARAATTPSTVGDAMEHPVRQQLEQILPRGIGVGSGFVIDSYGHTSKQTDVVLYEKDICPIFSINNTLGTTYYPCEGVIAVGQIKSTINRNLLREDFEKIASVKSLQRFAVHDFMPHPTTGEPIVLERSYGSLQAPSTIIDVGKGQTPEETSQIFGFLLVGHPKMKPDTLTENFRQLTSDIGEDLSPNMAALLTGELLQWGNITKKRVETTGPNKAGTYGKVVSQDGPPRWEPSWSAQKGELLRYSDGTEPFRTLIRWIFEFYRMGKTSDARAFDRYLLESDGRTANNVKIVQKNGLPSSGGLPNIAIIQ